MAPNNLLTGLMQEPNHNLRLEAFCDAVFAIAITLLIIDIKIPPGSIIHSSEDLWQAIKQTTPSILAFLLSFAVILITWVNHHNNMRLVNKSSVSYLYANGFLLLTVVFIPFPTSLLGEFLFTTEASPAVILYESILALQAVGWILICQTALKNKLGKNEKADRVIRRNGTFGYFATLLYSICAFVAIWFPLVIAGFTAITWIFWIIVGINTRHEKID
jgi:uncharacterized membrane protein